MTASLIKIQGKHLDGMKDLWLAQGALKYNSYKITLEDRNSNQCLAGAGNLFVFSINCSTSTSCAFVTM